MPLVPALCTQCGSKLEIDSNQEAALCPYCHTPFVTEKAINNYNTTNVTNIDNLHANVVNISEDNSRENKIKSGDTFIKLGDYGKAEKVFIELTNDFPYDYRSWWGLIRVRTLDFNNINISRTVYNEICNMYQKLKTVAEPSSLEKVSSIYTTYITKCDIILKEGEDKRKQELGRVLNQLEKLDAAEKKEIDSISSVYSMKCSHIKNRINFYGERAGKAHMVATILCGILIFVVICLTIMTLMEAEGFGETIIALVGAPLVFGVIAMAIFFVFSLIFVIPVTSKNGKNIKSLEDELTQLKRTYDSDMDLIKKRYSDEREKINKTKNNISRIMEQYN